jgi:glycosyltransferase involved in cell wall biosynthesis
MKVLFLRTDNFGSLSVGGSFSHTKGFIDGLIQLGHECVVVSSGRLPLGQEVRQIQIPYSPIFRNLPEVPSIAYNFRVQRILEEIVERERPDFMYHRHSEFNFASSVVAKRTNIPLVLEFNGSEVWVKKNWGTVYFENILRKAEFRQLVGAKLIGVISEAVKEELLAMNVAESKIFVNPNGVDEQRFEPGVDGSAIRNQYGLSGKFVAGFVGTFGAWHGVEVLARAVKPTIAARQEVHFLIVGDGNLRGEVERILREDGVQQYCTLAGSVEHQRIPEYLAACDVLLSPHVQNADGSTFFGSPTKLFEYMGMGKPIIASAVGQIAEVIHDGVNGLHMRHRDPEHLAELILMLAADPQRATRLGRAARQDAVNKYSWKQNAARMIEAVQSLGKK